MSRQEFLEDFDSAAHALAAIGTLNGKHTLFFELSNGSKWFVSAAEFWFSRAKAGDVLELDGGPTVLDEPGDEVVALKAEFAKFRSALVEISDLGAIRGSPWARDIARKALSVVVTT